MSTTTIQQNILAGLGESVNVANAAYLTFALRWLNSAYRNIVIPNAFKSLRTRTIFRMTNGQQTYQTPGDFKGFLTLKDETNSNVIDQITPEEFARDVNTTKISDETFTSDYDTAVSLENRAIMQYSETIADDADQTTVYTRDTDYTMNYTTGAITVDSTGSMSDSTEYYANYLHYTRSKPVQFALEYDATNAVYVFRVDPVPDDAYIGSLVYPTSTDALSGSVDPIWDQFEFCLERGGIYYGSLELIEDRQLRAEFKEEFREAKAGLIRLDLDLIPKHDRIPLVTRRTDYTSRTVRPLNYGGRR